jgi:hypothetical protein
MIVRSSGPHSLLRQLGGLIKEIAVPVPTYKLSDDSRLILKSQPWAARLHVHRYPRSLRVRPLVVQISAQRLT